MTLASFDAESVTAGTAVSSTDGSGFWGGVTSKAGAGSMVYSTAQKAHGTQSILVSGATAGTDSAFMDHTFTANPSAAVRFYYYATATPTTTDVNVAQLRASDNTASVSIVHTTSGRLAVSQKGGTYVAQTASGTSVLNQWVRIDLRATIGAGTTDGTIAASMNLLDATDNSLLSYAATNVSAGTVNFATARWGKTSSAGTLSSHFDDFAVDDGRTTLIGPSGTAALTATLALAPTSGTVPVTTTATVTASGGTGVGRLFAFAWGDGATTAAQAGNTATHSYSTAGSYTVTATVTES